MSESQQGPEICHVISRKRCSGQILRHQYGISVADSQTFLLAKRPQRRRARNGYSFVYFFIALP